MLAASCVDKAVIIMLSKVKGTAMVINSVVVTVVDSRARDSRFNSSRRTTDIIKLFKLILIFNTQNMYENSCYIACYLLVYR